jgi:uncharacterized membrane protein
MRPQAWLWSILAIALVLGAVFRVVHVEHRMFWADESWTALRVSGHTYIELREIFDGRIHPIADVQRFQTYDPHRGVAATISGLAAEEPQHPPVFYALDHWWAALFGSSAASLRSLSLLFSLAAIATVAWFAFELTQSRTIAVTAAAFMAVSPFFVNYAGQAREYSLWAALVSLTSVLLLRTLRRPGIAGWVLYGLVMAVSLYCALFMAFVMVAHACVVLLLHRRDRRALAAFFAASAAAALLFVPWLLACVRGSHTVWAEQTWTRVPYPALEFIEKWAFNIGAVLFDAEFSTLRYAPLAALIVAIIAAAVVMLFRTENRTTTTMLASIGVAISVPQIALDIVQHGHSSTEGRYMVPLWIALILAVAILFGRGIEGAERARKGWSACFCAVLVIAAWSCIVNSRATMWWDNDDPYPTIQMADAIVSHEPDPFVVSEGHWAEVLVIAHYLPPTTRFLLFKQPSSIPLASVDSGFVMAPSLATVAAIRAKPGEKLVPVNIGSADSAPLREFRSRAMSGSIDVTLPALAYLYRVEATSHS